MSTVALRRRALTRPGALAAGVLPLAAFLGVLLAASLFLRTRAFDAPFWIDEGLSVGIASHPLLDIPGVLRQDGSPPLYYMLLHVWMDLFGRTEEATHSLSLIFALASIPAALWAGWSLFGKRAGLVAAGLAALNPFLTSHGQETRMYALMVLLSLLATAAFAHAFVHRRRRYLVAFSVLLAAMLYSHNWSLFFGVGAAAALLYLIRGAEDGRPLLRDGVLAFGGAALLYAPWIPSLLFQVRHTGAPWAEAPSIDKLTGDVAGLFGGPGPAVALLLGGGLGLAVILDRRRSPERNAVVSVLMVGVLALVCAWILSQASPAWTGRYLAVALGPLLIAAAAGLSRAGRLGLVALALVAVFWAQPREYNFNINSPEREVVETVSHRLSPGDLVISTQPERLAVLHHYLPEGMRYATTLGPTPDPGVMDWRDSLDRLKAAKPEPTMSALLARVPEGAHVLLVRPVIRRSGPWRAPWTRLVRRRSSQWGNALARDERFLRTAIVPRIYGEVVSGVRGVLYTKLPGVSPKRQSG